jgi:mannan endo-1,4-beta-mannosidase
MVQHVRSVSVGRAGRRGYSVGVAALLAIGGLFASAGPAAAAIPEYRGVNGLGVYGYDGQSFKNSPGGTMKDWGVNMVRQPVFEFDRIPFASGTVPGPGGKGTLHNLQGLVNDIKTHVGPSTVTILCPFTWQGEEVLAQTPSAVPYIGAYKARLSGMAKQFAGQSNVWLEVWNEPYTVNGPGTWLGDMKGLVDSLRVNTGFTGKIVVPGGNYGGHESPILTSGKALVDYDPLHNIVFDLHAYSNFTENETATSIASRIQTIKNTGLDFIFGEFGPQKLGRSGTLDVAPFLTAVKQKQITALAWNWDSDDVNALHNNDGSLNNTAANYNWANQVLAYTRSAPAVPEPAMLAMAGITGALLLRRRTRMTGGR